MYMAINDAPPVNGVIDPFFKVQFMKQQNN